MRTDVRIRQIPNYNNVNSTYIVEKQFKTFFGYFKWMKIAKFDSEEKALNFASKLS